MSSGGQIEPSDCLDEMLVLQYVDGTLSPAAASDAREHVQHCNDCRDLIRMVERDRCEATLPATPGDDDSLALLSALRADRRDLTGQLIVGKYRLGARLGAGGMGVVYEAVNTWTERKVALKLLHPWFSSDADTVDRFRREAKSVGRISHPSIVQVLDLGQDPADGSLFMVQEFLSGDTLRWHLDRRGALPIEEAAEIMLPIFDALAAAHEAGVIHRDVKPENIILSPDRDGRAVPKLIDFGISKINEGDALLQTGRAIGTPLYMSPEQLRADGKVDCRTDVWSLGVVLFELLAGQRPFAAASHAEVATLILGADAPSLQSVAPQAPESVSRVVARALERDREARYPTTREMREAFDAARRSPAPAPAPARSGEVGRRRQRIWLYAALAVATLTASVMIIARARGLRAAHQAPAVEPSVVLAPATEVARNPRQPEPIVEERRPSEPSAVQSPAALGAPAPVRRPVPSKRRSHLPGAAAAPAAGKPAAVPPAAPSPPPAPPGPKRPPLLDL